jgi:hypothetical protein
VGRAIKAVVEVRRPVAMRPNRSSASWAKSPLQARMVAFTDALRTAVAPWIAKR